MKPVQFQRNSLAVIRAFPDTARRETGLQLDRLQRGLDPCDWKPMPSVGRGVREIRVRAKGQYRVVYVATLRDRIVVLHAFRKKTQKTPNREIERSRQALKELMASIGR